MILECNGFDASHVRYRMLCGLVSFSDGSQRIHRRPAFSTKAANDTIANIKSPALNDVMRAFIPSLTFMALAAGCSQTNLLDRQPSSESELREKVIGFGWNYSTGVEGENARYVDVKIFPDDHYEVDLGEYHSPIEPRSLQKSAGELSPSVAAQLRRELAQLEPPTGSGFHATLPHCPQGMPPHIEYFIGFKTGNVTDVTILERDCATGRATEARLILGRVAARMRSMDGSIPVLGASKRLHS